jgi:hypothetical protein
MSLTRLSISRVRQQGDTLIEAIVGMALGGLIAMSSLYAQARSIRVQTVDGIRAQLVDQLRSQLQMQGVTLCGTTKTLTLGLASFSAVYTCTPYGAITVTFPGAAALSVTPATTEAQIITVAVTSAALGGTLTVSSR